MKKILLLLSIFIIWIFSFQQSTYAVKINVTEYIPWAKCVCAWNTIDWVCYWPASWFEDYPPAVYTCDVWSWMSWVYDTMWALIKYFTLLAAMGWVLFIVINWIQLSMGWMDSGVKESAKKRIVQTISWLVVLLLSWVILNAIAPWIYK